MSKRVLVGVNISDDWLCRAMRYPLDKLMRWFIKEDLGNMVCFATALPGENGFFGAFDPDNENALKTMRICKRKGIHFMTVCSFLRPAGVDLLQSEYGELFIGSQALNETSTFLGLDWRRRKRNIGTLRR